MCLKVQPLISSGLAYKLRSGALWRRRHSGVQNYANAACAATVESHEPHAGHEGTYHPAAHNIPLTAHTPYQHSYQHHHTTSGPNKSNPLRPPPPLSVILHHHPVFSFQNHFPKVVTKSIGIHRFIEIKSLVAPLNGLVLSRLVSFS